MPATVQAAIEARIDRLTAPAKQTLNAAAVIGAHFGAELLAALGIDAVLDEALSAELIDQVRFTPHAEYAFHHPLIRAVAYESQLKSDRAQWHRRLAAAIQERAPASVDDNAALIAEHLEPRANCARRTAGTCAPPHGRPTAISTPPGSVGSGPAGSPTRCLSTTPTSCRAHRPPHHAVRHRLPSSRIQESRGRFAELRELCTAAGDKVSLAIGMTGLITEVIYAGRPREASRLSSEQVALLESIGDPTLTVGLAFAALVNRFHTGEFGEVLRWSQTVIDLAAGDPTKGAGFGFGSPLAIALACRGTARWWLGRPGWRQDLHDAVAMARNSDPATLAGRRRLCLRSRDGLRGASGR